MEPSVKPQPLAYIMRYHRELLVDPMFWTSRHLDLIGCRFQSCKSTEYTQNNDVRQAQSNDNALERSDVDHGPPNNSTWSRPSDPKRLAEGSTPLTRLFSLIRILEYEGSTFEQRRERAPKFYFAGRSIHRPDFTVFGRRKEANSLPDDAFQCLIGYFDYTSASCGRQNKFQARCHPGGGDNAPVGRLHNKRLAKITPANWEEDPYFLCLLLALAQLQKKSLQTKGQKTYTSRLLVSKWQEPEFIHLYEAQFTSDLLEAIENPKDATAYLDWPTISRKKIPFKPYDTFRARLVAELSLPENRHCHNASDTKDATDVVKGAPKRQSEEEDVTRTVRRKVDMTC
ncbi:unnamed protein product [Penicillium salamii]|nr:unnamed protein product [Penicillium salamii]CAG8012796.1 unnamed protein product [Penicillium salamii]CAG8366870.1 unnamed protein product [Penicillium salamii]